MTADLRRFDFALEPLRRQRKWQLEALQADLGKAQRALTEAEGEFEALRVQLRSESLRAAKLLLERVDPSSHHHSINFLVQLRDAIAASEARVAELRAERDRVRAACLVQQQKLDVIERHREECVAEFQQHEEARLASDADRDWLSRRQWATKAAEGEP